MKTNRRIQVLDEKIKATRVALNALGPLRPGSLSRQYHVCRKPGCCCQDPINPGRHGPCYHLDYVHHGKKTTRFIRAGQLLKVRRQLATVKLSAEVKTANLRSSSLIRETWIGKGGGSFFPRMTVGNVCHQRRSAQISGSKSEFGFQQLRRLVDQWITLSLRRAEILRQSSASPNPWRIIPVFSGAFKRNPKK